MGISLNFMGVSWEYPDFKGIFADLGNIIREYDAEVAKLIVQLVLCPND